MVVIMNELDGECSGGQFILVYPLDMMHWHHLSRSKLWVYESRFYF